MNTKQVIVMRKDLNMRRGKECAQASHASMSWLTRRLGPNVQFEPGVDAYAVSTIIIKPVELEWLQTSYKKICVSVSSEQELMEIYTAAQDAGLEVHLVTDSGLTEFHGIATPTCCAIGPDHDDRIDEITGHLKIY